MTTTRLPELLTVEDAAAYLHASTGWVYRAAAAGTLSHYRVARRVVFTEDQLLGYLESCRVTGPAPRPGRPRRRPA